MSKLIKRLLNFGVKDGRVLIKLRVTFELVFVENLVGKVGLNQNVNVEVYECEEVGLERRRGIDVAVEPEEAAVGRLEAEDAVPAIRPEELRAQSPRLDRADETVTHLVCEKGVEDDERVLPPRHTRGPATMHTAVVFARADDDLGRFVYAFLQSRLEHPSEII